MIKLTAPQIKVLILACDQRRPIAHLRTKLGYGGFIKTLRFLRRHDLLDEQDRITDAGRLLVE